LRLQDLRLLRPVIAAMLVRMLLLLTAALLLRLA